MRTQPVLFTLMVLFSAVALVVAALPGVAQDQQPGPAPLALVIEVDGPIGPATTRLVETGLAEARDRAAEVVVLRLNTPGGLASSMRDVVTEILASPIPVVGWVAPSGGHAASAGTFILYGTHVAAMAPGTNIGAASPVQIGGRGGFPGTPDEDDDKGSPRPDASEAKAMSDAVAFIRSLADLHGRNAEWAEAAVRDAVSIGATEALELGVIEVIANDLDTLLAAVDGREINAGRVQRSLNTAGATVDTFDPGALTGMLTWLANPNVALILMMIGIYGLIFEFMNPGTIGSGVIGAICLLLGLYALNQLPLNYTGLALMGLGIALMIAEAFTPTFGILGLGGAVAFLLGGAMLMDTGSPHFQMSWPVLIGATAVTGGFALLVVRVAWRAHRRRVHSGRDDLVGSDAVVLSWQGREGYVWAHGERWHARSPADVTLERDETVRITALHGLILDVEPPSAARPNPNGD